MMGWGVAHSAASGSARCQARMGGAIDDEIACAYEAAVQRQADHDDEQGLGHGGAGARRSFPLLRRAGHSRSAVPIMG